MDGRILAIGSMTALAVAGMMKGQGSENEKERSSKPFNITGDGWLPLSQAKKSARWWSQNGNSAEVKSTPVPGRFRVTGWTKGSLAKAEPYTHFVIQRTPGMPSRPFKHESDVVISGWEFEEDAKDDLKAWEDQGYAGLKVYTRSAMKMVGYDTDPENFREPN